MSQVIRFGTIISTTLIDVNFPCKSGLTGSTLIFKSGLTGVYHWKVWEGRFERETGAADSFDAAVESVIDVTTQFAGKAVRLEHARSLAEAVCAEYGNVTLG